jgi:selenocysteine lyase/cysteine desulfurase
VLAEFGIEAIEDHVLRLGGLLRAGVETLALPLLTPEAPAERAANVVFAADDPDRLERELRKRSVLVWSGDGRIRMSLHAYTDEEDVERTLHALAGIGGP